MENSLKNSPSGFESANFEPLSIVDQLTTSLLNKILSGELAHGERLVELKLAKQSGVGQGTVREALIQLEHRGFVTRIPGRGTFVMQLTDDEIKAITQVRLPLEMLAVELAKKNLTPQNIDMLSRTLESMKAASEENSLTGYSRADLAFHQGIWSVSGNQFLLTTLKSLCNRLFGFGLSRNKIPSQAELRTYVEQHRKLLESLIRDDVKTSQQIMADHIQYFWPPS
jgi:DNA-binding GntR family transcriptional regulator